MIVGAPRILVVDDSRLALSSTKQVLNAAGYQNVVKGNTVSRAFEVLGVGERGFGDEGDIDLILMDIVMPEMNGIEACRRIKACPHLKDVPVIMVTARDDMESLGHAFEAGAIDFITKPIREVELLARVHSALTLKQEMDRRKANEQEMARLNIRLADANRKLKKLSSHDPLTGLANRRTYEDALDRQWRRCTRDRTHLAVAMLDIDFFKKYNDSYGHQQGDVCLETVAKALEGGMHRPHDLVARYGGEEFVVLMPSTPQEGALQMAEALRRRVEELNMEHAGSQAAEHVTVSVGLACAVPTSDTSPAQLVEQADQALYEAKARGRNRVVTHWELVDRAAME